MSIVAVALSQLAHPVALVAGAAVGQVPAVAKYIAAKKAAAKAAAVAAVAKVEAKL